MNRGLCHVSTRYQSGRFLARLKLASYSSRKKKRRLQTGTLSTVYDSETHASPRSNARVTPPFSPLSSPPGRRLTCPSALTKAITWTWRCHFRRSVVRFAFGQASSAPPRVARRCAATARARPLARGCSSPAAAGARRVNCVVVSVEGIAPVGMPCAGWRVGPTCAVR